MEDENFNLEEEGGKKSSLLDKGINTVDTVKKTADAAKTAKTVADAAKVAKAADTVSKTSKLASLLPKIAPALPIIGYILLGLIVVIFVAVIVQSVIDSFSLFHGVDEEEIATNPEYNMSVEDLGEKLASTDYCEGQTFWEKITAFIEDSTDSIDSVCEGVRAIKNTVEYFEKDKYADYDLKLSPGLLISTIVYAYSSGEIETEDGGKLDSSSPMQIMEDVFKNGYITKTEIKNMVEYMIFNQDYDYYEWDVVREVVDKKDADGNVVHTTKYWGCKEMPSEEDHYMDYVKYFTFLRYGWDEATGFDYAGKTTTDIKTGNTTYAKSGYEWDKNQALKWLATPDWCKSDSETPILPEDTEEVSNKLEKSYNSKSKEDFGDYDVSLANSYFNYNQAADYENLVDKDEFLPIMSYNKTTKKIETHYLDYSKGFVYRKYKNFAKEVQAYDEKFTPKNIELLISRIDQHEDTFNEILGVKISGSTDSSFGGDPVFGNNLVENAKQFEGWKRDNFVAAGLNPANTWCAWFVSYVISQTPGVSSVLNYSNNSVSAWMRYLADRSGDNISPEYYNSLSFISGGYTYKGGAYKPKAGDLIFFVTTGFYHGNPYNLPPASEGNSTRHIGIVVSSDGKTVTSISGNSNCSKGGANCVDIDTYSLSNTYVIGYGVWE